MQWSGTVREQTFIEKLHECNQHKKRLLIAKEHLEGLMPLNIEKYNSLDAVEMSFVDQMVYRFSKLQDTLGEKIFKAILGFGGEDVKRMTFIDRLNRLEELGLLYKDEWMKLRKLRNEIAHEYSFNQEEVIENINAIFRKSDDLLRIYEDVYSYCKEKFDFVKDSSLEEDK